MPRRVVDGEMIQASRARNRWRPVLALPGVEADVVVIAASGEERSALEREEQIEAQVIPIKADRALQICHFQVNVSDAGLGWNGCLRHNCLLLDFAWLCLFSVIWSSSLLVKVTWCMTWKVSSLCSQT
jgi:hypothetical protein